MLRFITAGESHGPCLTAILEGLPAGLKINSHAIDEQLRQRQGGFGRGGRMKIERDQATFLSGVRFGETTGAPITVQIKNRDWENWQEKMSPDGKKPADLLVTAPRPGHADLSGALKYGRHDIRDILERSSARETAARVALGAICEQFLQQFGIEVTSYVVEIGDIAVDKEHRLKAVPKTSELNCPDQKAEEKMREQIEKARALGDSLGGIFEVAVKNVPVGLGSHTQWDLRLDGRLAQAMLSIQAIKGVEIGDGFSAARRPGSRVHDEIFYQNGHFYRATNRAGGLEGGMSNGAPIIIRCAMKPIPTLMKPLHSVDIISKEEISACRERSDVCAVPAASLVGRAMACLVIAKALLEQFGGSTLEDVKSNYRHYCERLENF